MLNRIVDALNFDLASLKRNQLKVAATYFGGKNLLAARYIPWFAEHTTYVEPFGGSGGVLLNKPKRRVEVYNDTEEGVNAFFRCLRDDDLAKKLLRQLKLTPYSHQEHAFCVKHYTQPCCAVEKARRWYVATQQSYASIIGDTWSSSPSKSRANEIKNRLDRFEIVTERMRGVIVEHADFERVLLKYDSENTFHFIDPPYMHATRSGGGSYAHEMSDADHERLIQCVRSLTGTVMLCGYSHPMYEALLSKWSRLDTDHFCTSGNRPRATSRTERIWMNYRLADQRTLRAG